MRVPFRLLRREVPAPADAVLLPTADPRRLAAACARLGGSPRVYAVAGGVLVVPEGAGVGLTLSPGSAAGEGGRASRPGEGAASRPLTPPGQHEDVTPRPAPQSRGGPPPQRGEGEKTGRGCVGFRGVGIPLRRVAGDLFVPADADLSPALLPEEAVALTRDRGLVVLAGGGLAFRPADPLPVSAWLAPAGVRRGGWQPLPPRPDRADRLTAIKYPHPPSAAVVILRSGEPDGADPLTSDAAENVPDDARPPAGSKLGRAGGAAMMGLGGFLAWLGQKLNAPGLARAGATLARKAIEQAPRLSEKVLGAQEAALREVLRQLRSGDVEKGLRRAPPAVADPSAPARVGTDADLGRRDPRYDLGSLVGGGARGVTTAWLGGGDVWAQLAAEYRRLAQEAAARGDVRRAAYLYGVLLRDLRAAANVLASGGLHRDAAVLYRDKLEDLPAAAAAFDKAGDYDEAVRLYETLGRFEDAAELLRRIGDEERAVETFGRAAEVLARRGQHVAAGDLIRAKVGDRLRAAGYYRRGWEAADAEAVACGERLLDELLAGEDWRTTGELFADAEARFSAPGHAADAGRFFNHARAVGELHLPAAMRAELDDRTRMLFATHLRARVETPRRAHDLVDGLFGREGNWAGPVVRDVSFAFRRAARPATPATAPQAGAVQLAAGTLTAAAVTRDSFDLVVATTGGVVVWRPGAGKVQPVFHPTGTVVGLSAGPGARAVFVLVATGEEMQLRSFDSSAAGVFKPMAQNLAADAGDVSAWYLQPVAAGGPGGPAFTLANPWGRTFYRGVYLRSEGSGPFVARGASAHLLLTAGDTHWEWDSGTLTARPVGSNAVRARVTLHWTPAAPPGNPLRTKPLDWLTPHPGVLELAGVDADGVLHWARLDASSPDGHLLLVASETDRHGFTAACLAGPGVVVAATGRNVIRWLRVATSAAGSTFRPTVPPQPLAVPARVGFLAYRPPGNEVVAVLADGSAVRLPRP